MKKIISSIAFATLLLTPIWAQADFIGDYAPGNWTVTNNNSTACSTTGGVDASGAPASVMLIECNGGGGASTISLTIDALADGIFNFDWLQGGGDQSWAGGGYYLGSQQVLYSSFSGQNQSGSITAAVSAGQTIGWYINSVDSVAGSSTLTISNFSAPSAVPEPGTLALLGLGLVGMAARRRKKV